MSDKLFSNPLDESIIIKNVVFDYIMPTLSGDAWKVLCVAIRHTLGKQARPVADHHWISQAQFMQNAGLPERKEVNRALQECVYAGYLIEDPENQKSSQPNYALNSDFEMRVPVAEVDVEAKASANRKPPSKRKTRSTKAAAKTSDLSEALLNFGRDMGIEPDPDEVQKAMSANDESAITAWIELGHRMTNLSKAARFKTVIERLQAGVPPMPLSMLAPDDSFKQATIETTSDDEGSQNDAAVSQEDAVALWDEMLQALRSQMRSSMFKWFKPTKAISLTDNVLTVVAPNKRTKDWLEEGQLSSTIQETFASVSGGEITLNFVVES